MKVFISWSKEKSEKYAIRTKALLESVTPKIESFVSEVDIYAGEDVQDKIIQKIVECDKLVLCFTRENKRAPWLLFEAGYARALKKTVIPLLFDPDSNWHSWVDNPMNVAREVNFNHPDFVSTFINTFGVSDTPSNRKKINAYMLSINEIKENFRAIDICCEDLVEKLAHHDAFVAESPTFRDKTAHFLTGFESFDLLKIVTESFRYTGKHLWVYGRKNMKLFSGNFQTFLTYLKEKAAYEHLGMDGIDFRCLFLDPESEEVERAHLHQNIFKLELETTILRARGAIGDNTQLRECFKFYSNKREEVIIRLDNSIILARPNFDANGRPQILTDSAFEVFGAMSPKGQECIKKFEEVWANAKPMY